MDIGAAAREGRPLVRHGSVHRCYALSLEPRCNSPHARSCDTAPLNGSMASLTRFPSAAREQLIMLLAVVDGGQAFVAERGKTLSHVFSRKMREPIPSRRHHFAAYRIDIEFYAAAPAILRKNREPVPLGADPGDVLIKAFGRPAEIGCRRRAL